MNIEDRKWLYTRVTPKDVAKAVHSMPFTKDKQKIHEVVLEAILCVENVYQENPAFFCGKSKFRILGGLVYILGLKHQKLLCYHYTERQIAKDLGYLFDMNIQPRSALVVVSAGFHDWRKTGLVDLGW